MTSRKMEEHLEEEQTPAKKSRISDPEEQQRGDVEPTGMNADKQNEAMDLASSRRRLPLEMNCEMYKFLKFPIQKKFIWGLGQGIYQMFGPKLLFKIKRLRNPKGNNWNYPRSRKGRFDATGMGTGVQALVYATKGFPISRELSRKDNYPGTILYYFEVTVFKHNSVDIGLSDRSIIAPHLSNFNEQNYYTDVGKYYYINGNQRQFDLRGMPERNANGTNVQGCGLVLDTNDKLAIFFTFNGKLKGKPIPICPSVDCLFPSVRLANIIIVANFGDDPEGKPFVYDIDNCPGLGLDCI